jgi:hypothetical protein
VELLTAALIAVLAVCAATLWALIRTIAATSAGRDEALRERTLRLLTAFAPAAAAAAGDPQALIAWHPIAGTARKLFPAEFAALDQAAGDAFPFSRQQIQAVHGRWTAEWLAWERAHDVAYKLKAQAAEGEVDATGGSALARARLDAVEREKLDLYQRRYEEYVRVGKALQALLG